MSRDKFFSRHQSGAALIVSLVLVAVALILALSSMQSSRIEEAMSGNQRATERAVRAAEFGASQVVKIIQNKSFSDPSSSTLQAGIFCDTGSEPCVSRGLNEVEGGMYYRINVSGSQVYSTLLEAEGLVFPEGVDLSELNDSEIEDLVVARRHVDFSLRLEGLGKLAAFNPVCTASYRATSQASGLSGEETLEVDGRFEPAISTSSLEEANAVVRGVVISAAKKDISLSAEGYATHDDVVFVKDSRGGRYHAREVVVPQPNKSAVYVNRDDVQIDYGNCRRANDTLINNPMCSYQGGISAYSGAKILERPDAFHEFISAILRDPSVNYTTFSDQALVFDQEYDFSFDDQGSIGVGINVITNDQHRLLAIFSEEGGVEHLSPAAFDADHFSFNYDSNSDGEMDAEVAKFPVVGGLLGELEGSDINPVEFSEDGFNINTSVAFGSDYDSYLFARHPYPSSLDALSFNSSVGIWDGDDFVKSGLIASEYLPTSQRLFLSDGTSPDGKYVSLCGLGQACFSFNPVPVSFEYRDNEVDLNGDGINGSTSDIMGVARDCLGCANANSVRVHSAGNDLSSYNGYGGVLIVDGHAQFQGNPNFKGLIIVLGDYSIGGGGGGHFYGASIAFPYFYNHEAEAFECQSVIARNNGSGSHQTIHNSEAIQLAFSLLPDEAMELWIVGNESELYSYVLEAWQERLVN